mgnify:CR=1 FL=1
MPIYYYEDGTTENVHETQVEDFLAANPTATLEPPTKEEEEVEKTKDVAEPGAAVASETAAPISGASFSEDISLDVPDVKLEPGEFGKIALRQKKEEEFKESLKEKQPDKSVVDAASNLKSTESAEIVQIVNDVLSDYREGNESSMFETINNLNKETKELVLDGLEKKGLNPVTLEGVTIPEVIAGEDPSFVGPPEFDYEKLNIGTKSDFIRTRVASINEDSESTKKAWGNTYFKLDDFEAWQNEFKGPMSQRTQNQTVRKNLNRKDKEEYIKQQGGPDAWELYQQFDPLNNGTLTGDVNLKDLIANEKINPDIVKQAIQMAKFEEAQIQVSKELGTSNKVEQLELLREIQVAGQDIGEGVYRKAFDKLYEEAGAPSIAAAYPGEVFDDRSAEDFMKVYQFAKAQGLVSKGDNFYYETAPGYILRKIDEVKGKGLNRIIERVNNNNEQLEKDSKVISSNIDIINKAQEDLLVQIEALDEIENPTNKDIIKRNNLIGKYKANQRVVDNSNVGDIAELFNKQIANLDLEIEVLNKQFDRGEITEDAFESALGKNYNNWERAWANIEEATIGGYDATAARFGKLLGMPDEKTLDKLIGRAESKEQAFANKVLWSSQNFWQALGMSAADNASTYLNGALMFTPLAAVGYANYFTQGFGGSVVQQEREKRNASKYKSELEDKIALETNEQELWRLNRQLEQQNKILNTKWYEENGAALISGFADMAMERFFGAGLIARNFSKWSKVGANASLLQKGVGNLKGLGLSVATELPEEHSVSIINNSTNRFLLNRDVSLTDGIDWQTSADIIVGAGGMSSIGTAKNSYNEFKNMLTTNQEKQTFKLKLGQISKVNDQLNSDNITEDKKEELLQYKTRLLDEMLFDSARTIQKVESLSADQIEEIGELDRQRHNAKKEILNQAYSGEYGLNMSSTDQSILEDAKNQYDELNDKIDAIAGIETKKHEDAAEKAVNDPDRKNTKSKAELVYEQGIASFSNSSAKALAKKKGMGYTEVSREELTDEFFAKVQKDNGLTDEQLEQFKKDALGSVDEQGQFAFDNAKFIDNGKKGNVYVFTSNQQLSITNGTGLEGKIAAVSGVHEVLHRENIDQGLIKDGEIVDAAKVGITGLDALMKSKLESNQITQEAYDTYISRREVYNKDLEENGVNYEETLNLVNDLVSIGAVKRNDFNMLFGIKNFMNKMMSITPMGKKLNNFINFNDTETIFSYISSFNKAAYGGKILRGSAAEERDEEARMLASKRAQDAFTDDAIAEELGLKQTTTDIVQKNEDIYKQVVKRAEKEGVSLKDAVTSEMKSDLVTNNYPRVVALANQAARAAENIELDESLKIKDVGDWTQEYALKLMELANSWDPAQNDSFGAYMNQLLPKKYSGILDKLKAKVETTSAERDEVGQTAYGNTIDEGPSIEDTIDEDDKPKKAKGVTLVNDIVNLSDKMRPNEELGVIKDKLNNVRDFEANKNEFIDKKGQEAYDQELQTRQSELEKAESNYQSKLQQTDFYKAVKKGEKDLTPKQLKLKPLKKELQKGSLRPAFDIAMKEMGLDPNKVAKMATMPQGEIRDAQRFIAQNFDLLIGSLPEGFTSEFKATGVENVLLNAFYNKKVVRAKTKAGNEVWVKKPVNSILKDKAAAMAVFGLTEAGIPNIVKKDANVAPPIQAVARWFASNMVNQAIREMETSQAKKDALNDGKSNMLSSKMVIKLDKSDPALGIEFRSMLPELGEALAKRNTLDRASVRSAVEEVYSDILTKPQITQFVADLTKPKTGILARYDLLDKNYKEVKAELFNINEFIEMEAVMTEAAALNQIGKILGVDTDRAKLLADTKTVNRIRKTVITGFATDLENSGLSDADIVKVVLAIKEMYASAGKIGKGENSTNGNPGGEVQKAVDGSRSDRQSGQITEGAPDFFALIKNGSQKVYDLMMLSDKGSINRKKLSEKYGVSFESYSESSAVVLKEIENGTFDLKGRKNQAKFNQDVTLRVLEFVKNKIDEGILNKGDALVVVGAFGSNMKSPSRKAAYAAYAAENANTFKNPGKDLAYDHMKPHNVVMNQVVNAVFNTKNTKKKQEQIKEAFNDYVVGIIPEAFDTLLTTMGMQYNMQTGYDPKATGYSGVLGRLYNDRTLGGNGVVAVRSLETGKVFGESFVRASNLLNDNVLERNEKKKLSKVISTARMQSSKSVGMSTFDFDDTLAFTKSGIRLTRPNNTGKPQPGRKAILLVGAAGAGKTTVIDQLDLRKQGFKYVNQDVALDWLSKNSGLPQNMNDFTREQSSKWLDLQYEAASAAKNKAAKLRGKGDGVIIDSTGGDIRRISRDFQDAGYDVQVVYVNSSLDNALARNKSRTERRLTDTTVRNSYEKVQKSLKGIKELVNFFPYSVKEFVEVNTDNIKQGDALPTEFVGKVNDFTTGYIKERINAEEFAAKGADLLADGAEFDFSEFNKVVDGTPGPLLQKMKNQVEKYGPDNVYVLTARPAASAGPIHQFLKDQGIDIPLENITGLGNSTGDAKAAWMLDKYAEGYNDMYFVDDAMQNVEAVQHVFNQLDIKGKSVQAKMKSSKMSIDFNKMLERTKGIGAEKTFSRIGAQKRGKNVGRFTFFVPPSADDFAGLLRYFVGKGEQGNKDLEFFKKVLIDPFARADRDMKEARQAILEDYKALRKEFPKVAKKLGKMIDDSGFTFDNAIRVYLWDKAGFEIPGLSKRDIKFLTNKIKTDQDLKNYADVLGLISKLDEGYIKPSEYWDVESIASDLQNIVNKEGRKKYLAEWIENKNELFSPENLNKIEAVYGSNFREALENILWRMENGTNRAKGMGRIESAWNNWVNNSVGAIMFFNARSAVLQTLSTVNFINFEDNNMFAAAKAFANQKQYWKDFSFLFNSDFLKQRRAGLQTNINEAELASAVAGAANKAKAALQYLLKIGFTPTQIADSFAIAAGGSTYYRNRVKKYVKEGMDQKAAEKQAMLDFQEIAEETQQSARPDRISQQQASSLGRIVLAFANTPMQYARLIKKAAGDLVNGRGDWRSNISRIVYYGAIQNIIFSSLQSAVFALAFKDEEPEEDEINTKTLRTLNGMADSLLRGSGLAGAVVSTLKNTVMRFLAESKKDYRADYGNVLVDALNVSPPIGSKARKLYNATKTYKYNKEVMGEMSTFDLENPIWDAVGNVVSATTNLPLDRGFRKIDNMKEALNQDNETWQRIFVGLGWDQWSLGIDSRKEVDEVKKEIKRKKKEEKEKSPKNKSKSFFNLNKAQQVIMLEGLGLSDEEIKQLKLEKNRVDELMKYYNKDASKVDSLFQNAKEYKPPKKEKKKPSIKGIQGIKGL